MCGDGVIQYATPAAVVILSVRCVHSEDETGTCESKTTTTTYDSEELNNNNNSSNNSNNKQTNHPKQQQTTPPTHHTPQIFIYIYIRKKVGRKEGNRKERK